MICSRLCARRRHQRGKTTAAVPIYAITTPAVIFLFYALVCNVLYVTLLVLVAVLQIVDLPEHTSAVAEQIGAQVAPSEVSANVPCLPCPTVVVLLLTI